MERTTSHLWAEIQAWLDALPFPPSQARLAERLGLKSRTVITDWKYGASRPTPEHLHALAREMEHGAGPHVYEQLLTAVMRDMGYDVPGGQRVEVAALPDGNVYWEAKKAARRAPSAGRARRAAQDSAGQESQDPGGEAS